MKTYYIVTYADSENCIRHSGSFEAEAAALKWIDANKSKITPFKVIKNEKESCPETVKDFRNYVQGKYSATKFCGYIRA